MVWRRLGRLCRLLSRVRRLRHWLLSARFWNNEKHVSGAEQKTARVTGSADVAICLKLSQQQLRSPQPSISDHEQPQGF